MGLRLVELPFHSNNEVETLLSDPLGGLQLGQIFERLDNRKPKTKGLPVVESQGLKLDN